MKTKRKVYDAAESIKPYVDRAMNDERLRDDLMRAYGTAKDLYRELMGETKSEPVRLATRVATDEDVRERLRQTIEDLRAASDRLQGKRARVRRGRKTGLLVGGIALGILLNPVTGPETRRFIKEMVTGGGSSDGGPAESSNGSGGS